MLAWSVGLGVDRDVMATFIAADGASAQSAWSISDHGDATGRPELVVSGGVPMVAWHDNRDEYAVDPVYGEVYSAVLSCP